MKILHTYEDGTLKVKLDSGAICLQKPTKDIEMKILVKVDGATYSIPLVGGLPAEIEHEDQAPWIKLSGTNLAELLYKAMANCGMTVTRAFKDASVSYNFLSSLKAIKDVLFENEKPAKD
jgi:hypothetical protein